MTLKYYKNYVDNLSQEPSEIYKSRLQAQINQQMINSSSYYKIFEEESFGSENWSEVGVRVVHIIQQGTGTKISDDFKEIIFQDFEHARGIGVRYKFDDNIWMTISSDNFKYVTPSSVVRRCNNSMNWYINGVLHKEPCIIDYDLAETTFIYRENIFAINGAIKVITQNNSYTSNINIDDDFMFGGQSFKVRSKNNLILQNTYDSETNKFISFTMFLHEVNSEVDDVEKNVSDGLKENNYAKTGIRILPIVTDIRLNKEQNYSVYYYTNDIKQNHKFTISAGGVPIVHYDLTALDGTLSSCNTFKVKNNFMNISSPLIITCADNSNSIVETISIMLRGEW